MHVSKWLVVGATVLTATISSQAKGQSYIAACAASLTYTELASSDDLAVQYAYLATKIENMRSSGNTNGSVTFPVYGVPVSFGYSDAQTRAHDLSTQLGVNWNVKQAQAYVARYVSADSNSTFGKCVHDVINSNMAVLAEIARSDGDSVEIKVHIGTQAAARGDLDLIVLSNGEFIHGVQRRWTVAGGVPAVTIKRVNPGINMHVAVQVRSRGYELGSDDLTVPPEIVVKQDATHYEADSASSQASCGNHRGGVQAGWGNWVSIIAKPDETLDFVNETEISVLRVDGRRDVPMNSQQYHLDFTRKDAGGITARAWCAIWAHELYSWTGRFHVPVTKVNTTVILPIDNHLGSKETRAPNT